MSAVVIRASEPVGFDELRSALTDAYVQVRRAILDGQPVVLVVAAEDLLGHGTLERAAYVGALVGMTRAVAFEGAKPGWTINTVAVPGGHELSDAEAVAAVEVDGLSGQVLTVGTSLVGKVTP